MVGAQINACKTNNKLYAIQQIATVIVACCSSSSSSSNHNECLDPEALRKKLNLDDAKKYIININICKNTPGPETLVPCNPRTSIPHQWPFPCLSRNGPKALKPRQNVANSTKRATVYCIRLKIEDRENPVENPVVGGSSCLAFILHTRSIVPRHTKCSPGSRDRPP